jgi:hypothetical protein
MSCNIIDSNILFGGEIVQKYDHYASIGDQLMKDLKLGGDKIASVSRKF